ncbi:hypothetical protein PG996_005575 [Apiospora saccharicola]|uniref:Fibronectin type III-like domain-containing protein n=1 Tax=Apiospora saccharicola TaxID=335842 RepID=A0ABR1VLX6_9PEZI
MSLPWVAGIILLAVSVLARDFPNCQSGPLVAEFTVQEKIANSGDNSPGISRLGLPAYEWWQEALHGVAGSPGVSFGGGGGGGNFSYATSFPQPITMGAAFDMPLIRAVADIISTEARAFSNAGRAGLNFWTPNINPYRDPRWGRGQEVPSEDAYFASQYINELIPGPGSKAGALPLVATCKHYAGYDIENWQGNQRYGFNAVITRQDLQDYYLAPFRACARDADAQSFMCSYNAVNGVPTCADPWLLQDVLRDQWGFSPATSSTSSNEDEGEEGDRWVTSDCDALKNVWNDHHYGASAADAAARSLNAGTDLDCGSFWPQNLAAALRANLTTEAALDKSLIRRCGRLPERRGTTIAGTSTSGFATAAAAAQAADVIVYVGGIDNTQEWETRDRNAIGWPGQQLALIGRLAAAKGDKPLVVVQLGTMVDSSSLVAGNGTVVDALVWAGYPGQSGGQAVVDILLGTSAPAGRLPVTQYPASFVNQIKMTNMDLRPGPGNPGQTYKWYNGTPVFPFAHGLHYTTFNATFSAPSTFPTTFSTANLTSPINFNATGPPGSGNYPDLAPFATVNITVTNTGSKNVTSDYVILLFARGEYGPTPYPNKSLVGFARAHGVAPGATAEVALPLKLGALARGDGDGNLVLWPGKYTLALDVDERDVWDFEITGDEVVLERLAPASVPDGGVLSSTGSDAVLE